MDESHDEKAHNLDRPSSEISAVVSQCAKYGDIRGYERLKDYYTKEKMQYFLVTFNHERDVDAAVKALRHKKKYGLNHLSSRIHEADINCRSGGGIWFCDKIPRRKYVDVAFMRNGGK